MIFVTGGTGFLGRHLVATLCQQGYSLRILTRQPHAYPWLQKYHGVEVVPGDLLDSDALHEGVKGCTHVIHAGGKFRFWGDEAEFMKTNAIGTKNLLSAAARAGVQRFIHISSAAVIGKPDPSQIIDETHPPIPVDAYQRSKLEGEQAALSACSEHNLPVIVLRPGAFYGPLGTYAFNRLFFRDPMRGIIMQVDGGRHIIFPAYIQDVVQGVILALDRGRVGEIYNICGDWIAHKDAFDIVCEEADLSWPRLSIPGWLGIWVARVLEIVASVTGREPFWPANLESYVYNNWRISTEKARRELGFQPTNFRDGARRTIAWYRAGRPEHIPEVEC